MNNSSMLQTLRVLGKGTAILFVLALYLLVASLIAAAPLGRRRKRTCAAANVSFFCRRFLPVLGVRIGVEGWDRLRDGHAGRLIVANHLSYVDILILASLSQFVFVTSVELGNTPVLGLLSRLGGSIFVERRNPASLKEEIALISRVISEGFSVVLFPEGTTSNGESVRIFKKSLFDAAIQAESEVLPVCLRYRKIDGCAITNGNRDSLFYYGGVTFFQHALRLLALRTIDVDIVPLDAIPADPRRSRKELAALCHRAIDAAYEG